MNQYSLTLQARACSLALLIDNIHIYEFLPSVPSSVCPLLSFRRALVVYDTYEGPKSEVTKIILRICVVVGLRLDLSVSDEDGKVARE